MANNKITLGNETLIDLTEDTVTEDTLLEGNTAHDASGNIITGRAIAGASNWDDLSGKPFESIDNTTLVSNEGVLSAVTPDQYIEAVSSEFTVSNKTLNLSYATEQKIAEIDNKADSATTLSGYGITDTYTKTETNGLLDDKIDEPATEGTNGQALVTDGNGGRSWKTVTTPQYIESVTDDFTVTNKKLALSTSITTKLSNIDDSADWLKSKNLITRLFKGTANQSTGEIVETSSGTLTCTDFIKVEPNKTYTISVDGVAKPCRFYFYSTNATSGFVSTQGYTDGVATIPSNCYYTRIATGNFGVNDNAQLELGSSATDYTPYAKSNVEITKELSWVKTDSNFSSSDSVTVPISAKEINVLAHLGSKYTNVTYQILTSNIPLNEKYYYRGGYYNSATDNQGITITVEHLSTGFSVGVANAYSGGTEKTSNIVGIVNYR